MKGNIATGSGDEDVDISFGSHHLAHYASDMLLEWFEFCTPKSLKSIKKNFKLRIKISKLPTLFRLLLFYRDNLVRYR